MNLSLIACQMMRVISSPSSSTTGFLTLILAGPDAVAIVRRARSDAAGAGTLRRDATGAARVEPLEAAERGSAVRQSRREEERTAVAHEDDAQECILGLGGATTGTVEEKLRRRADLEKEA